jgi:hyperosmotically inducible protein
MRYALVTGLLIAACSAPGYRDPGDSDEVREAIDDRNIASRVRIALARDPETAPYEHIRVACRRGVVTLDGEVDRPEVRLRAVRIARGCEGVKEVTDAISVRDPSG